MRYYSVKDIKVVLITEVICSSFIYSHQIKSSQLYFHQFSGIFVSVLRIMKKCRLSSYTMIQIIYSAVVEF